ncbi:quinol dehydrogenase periplasmic component [Stieleria neptunia]|uniref:Quinol dehydrogenase periplasmic component n=1 Tax=Stieleria neptunia TaxID=2527979 RepID=A0A518HMJ0_9BACT|nr:4Fe-4S dicluster domain-containing protein [Stieleria neptunia]QDV42074.1 quinol dehydrogenase periplasmic component [Stieleria neptunia]
MPSPADDNQSNRKPRLNRRDLLQGRLWKLIRPSERPPLVMRYPKTRADVDASPPETSPPETPSVPPRSIGGIAIEPVRPTEFTDTAPPRSFPVFRPPGAVAEPQFLAGCTRCSDCADACPYDAIIKAPERMGAIAGTPTIDADANACLMCEDFPCISACEPGVLSHALPKTIGTAKITEHLCLAHHSTTCTVCSERCPTAGVIEVVDGKPTIDEAACTGCGVCRYVCPAPENAILLMPLFNRPSLP